ncbi:hypothetical protein BZA77DRAFT_321314 [Pyronema omphalodes]|nr:hypothetical protein BZA77DRAFT_321314 [Pyronema omphalodes]
MAINLSFIFAFLASQLFVSAAWGIHTIELHGDSARSCPTLSPSIVDMRDCSFSTSLLQSLQSLQNLQGSKKAEGGM